MYLLNGKIRNIYFKYLGAAFGSAIISSIYSLVDLAMVGHYQGPSGTAALAVVGPIYSIIYSLGLLTGIGGSVLYSAQKGKQENGGENEYFTIALIVTIALAVTSWWGIITFSDPLLRLFGAEEMLLALAKQYLFPISMVIPAFLFNQMLSAFLRNDGNPGLATVAVLAGGIFNVFGDYFFVFKLDMGIQGAGVATAIGTCITLIVLLMHFVTPKNTLRLVRTKQGLTKMINVIRTGFSSFFTDVAMGILAMLFNRHIIRYLGTDALSVYGVITNISTIVQCCAYSVGQATQPIISINFGAKRWERIRETLRYAMNTVIGFGLLWALLLTSFPDVFIHIFMKPTAAVLDIAPAIMRRYGLSYLLLPLNVFAAYYCQSLMKSGTAFLISVSRGFVISGCLIFLLPLLFGADSIWFVMPVTELITAIVACRFICKYTRELARGRNRNDRPGIWAKA